MNTLSLALILLAVPVSAKLTLVPNTKEILQRDNVLLLSLLENDSISAVRLFGDYRGNGRWFRHEIQIDGKWSKLTPDNDPVSPIDAVGNGPLLDGKSTYAECDILHRRSFKGAFLFEKPGTYQIRVVATMPWGELASEPVTITVRKRADADLEIIEGIPPEELRLLAIPSIKRPLSEKLRELRSVGGNIGLTIDQCLMMQVASEGGEWKGTRLSKEKNCEWLSENMDPVTYEHSLDVLGSYYRTKQHWEGLSRVALAMKYDSVKRRGFVYQLQLLTKPPLPQTR